MKKTFCTTTLLALSILGSAVAQNGKIHSSLTNLEPGHDVDVIIRYRDVPVEADLTRLAQYGRHKAHLSIIRSSAMTVKSEQVARLAGDLNVEYIAPDSTVNATTFAGGADYGWMTALDITQTFGTLPYDGTGVGVAVVDTGLQTKQELNTSAGVSRIVYRQNFVTIEKSTLEDLNGHGLHVAGVIGGNGSKSLGGQNTYWIRGIAPNVNLIELRVLDTIRNRAG